MILTKDLTKNKMKAKVTKQESKPKELVPVGSHVARIYKMIHVGTIEGFQGKPQDKIRVGFELPDEMRVFSEEKGEQPMVMDKIMTLSAFEKAAFRQMAEACRGVGLFDGEAEAIDPEDLIGSVCLINVKQKKNEKNGNTYAYIDGFSALPKSMKAAEAINEPFVYDVLEHDKDKFEKLPQFIQDEISSSEEWKEKNQENGDDLSPEDIPF